MNPKTKKFLKQSLGRVGISGRDVRSGRSWVQTRVAAVRHRQPIVLGSAVVWTDRGRVELVPIETPMAGPGEVTINVHRSSVSVGTEKARFLELPHAKVEYPSRPGYSGAGEVIAVGRGVEHVRVGDMVAGSRIFHQSVQTLDARFVHRIDPDVSVDAASLLELAIIATNGIERGGLIQGVGGHDASAPLDYVVVGTGAIGALADRMAAARGFGPGTLVASSRAKEFVARAGQRFLTLADTSDLAALQAAVVLESTSDPSSLLNAISFARSGGRIVLLGSPRGTEVTLPVDHLREHGKQLVGAHINLLDDERRRSIGQEFVDRLADGSVQADDLVTDRVHPGDAAVFYRDRISDSDLLAAVFDWTALSDEDRCSKRRLVDRPEIRTGGVEYGDAPAARGSLGWTSQRSVSPLAPIAVSGSMRFGMVGCGEIAIQNANAITAAGNASLSYAFDPDNTLAHDLVDSFGGVAVGSFEQMLERSDLDAVVLCVPHHLHAPLAVQAFEAGKHVVLEKPLANSLASGREIATAEASATGTGSVCFPHRFDLRVRAATELVATGAIGDVTGFSLTFFQDKPPSYWVGGYSGRSISDWRTSPDKAGGGVLIMNACHYLDLLLSITGLDVSGVSATTSYEGGRAVEDAAFIAVTAANGATGSITVSSSVRGARYDELRIWGTDGHIEVFPTPRVYTVRPTNGLTASRWQDLGVDEAGPYRTRYFEQFATALDTGDPPAVTIADGLAVQALIHAAYESSDSGQRVDPRS